jgi:hypothetical protein
MIDLMPSLRGYCRRSEFQKIRSFHKNRAVNLHLIMTNRPERKISFLVVWLTMFSCISGMGQNLLKKTDPTPDFKHLWMPGTNAEPRGYYAKLYGRLGHLDLSRGVVLAKTPTTNRDYITATGVYYNYIQSGFFCKREWELEKATHIPFRFRLGSLAEMDAMEGKH